MDKAQPSRSRPAAGALLVIALAAVGLAPVFWYFSGPRQAVMSQDAARGVALAHEAAPAARAAPPRLAEPEQRLREGDDRPGAVVARTEPVQLPPPLPAPPPENVSSPVPTVPQEPPREGATQANLSPQLRQLDADLARLRAQAEAVSEDLEGLRSRNEAAQARKNACRDEACLRDWYARRRGELLAEF